MTEGRWRLCSFDTLGKSAYWAIEFSDGCQVKFVNTEKKNFFTNLIKFNVDT